MRHHAALWNYFASCRHTHHFDHIMIYHTYMWLTVEKGESTLFDADGIRKRLESVSGHKIP